MKETGYLIPKELIQESNKKDIEELNKDYDFVKEKLNKKGFDADEIVEKVKTFYVALPSWATSTGGTRFGTFPIGGDPRNVYEKLVDCKTVNTLTGVNNKVSLHIPWDKVEDINEFNEFKKTLDIGIDAMNSNTFQDQKNQKYSYKFGSLSATDESVRKQAIEHNIECIEIGKKIGSKALSIWIGDGGNFPGQIHFRKSFERYINSLKVIYKELPNDWKMFIEHKLFEPAFYSTVLNDWGSSYIAAQILGDKALCLVDLGHHAPNTNIEMIVSRLIQVGKLAGFHFNDSKYGDDDLDCGSINPYQLFLIFNELVDAEYYKIDGFNPCYMIDESHNVTDPIESLINSYEEIQKAYAKALIIDREKLNEYQEKNDALMSLRLLKEAYDFDVTAILKMARYKSDGAINPIEVYRKSEYRKKKINERNQ
ncbi:MAG TPA: L-rhamnose isomerase [Bacteroidota bacterium]|jgi:L-rhamnose isomerase/sugar isomerase|nr:L-rhamnose isomerase [Bacteroidota bacterium]